MRWWAALLLVLLVGCGGDDDPRVAALKEGGVTLVVRHATADQNVAQQEKVGDCATQRNLTEAGKEQAAAIGAGFERLDLPGPEVVASPLCRAVDTAKLAFGGVVEDEDLISPGVIGTEADDVRRAADLKERVTRTPPDGELRVLVTHTGNIGAALGEEDVAEGEALLYGEGGRLLGRIPAEEWESLGD